MPKFYWVEFPEQSRYTGNLNASHKWGLSGAHCPECGAISAGSATGYPSVDLSSLPEREKFENARPTSYEEFVRLRELVRPLVPPGAQLKPDEDCKPKRPPPCPKCGRDAFTRPEEPILDAASLPTHIDLFRLADFETMLIGTERFVDAVRRLEQGNPASPYAPRLPLLAPDALHRVSSRSSAN